MKESVDALIEKEYKIWRKNVPYLYDLVYTHALKWPTPTIQWFPDVVRNSNSSTTQRLLLTTYTAGEEQESVLIASITFPDSVDEDTLNNAAINFSISQNIPINIDVNRLKFSPHAPNIIACKTEGKDIYIYDYTKHKSFGEVSTPDMVLEGHTDGGFALDWNKSMFGELISAGKDKIINIFDINSGLKKSYKSLHTKIINDLSYSNFNPSIFSSVSDDLKMNIVDLRSKEKTLSIGKAHSSSIESVEFSPFKADLIATSSSDTTIKIWDIRSLKMPITTLRGHKSDAMTVKWSPHYESILASCSKDRRVLIWDLNKSGETTNDSSNELLFCHGGHSETVGDFDWNPAEPIEICSVSDDNLIHVWKIPVEEYI
ncbi:hypothetical protein NUSPORA_02168 [Nucleospora cyclopteri]